MEALSLLKFWRNRARQVNEDSFNLSVTYPQRDFDKVVSKTNRSTIVISPSVGITSLDNDTNKQCVRENLSKIDGQANASALNANVFSLKKFQTNFTSQSPVLVLGSSRKLRVSMLRFKKSSSLDKAELNCVMATPKREQSFKSKREKSEDSSSNKYLKLIKQASKIRIFDQAADSEKHKGNSSAVFRQVCKSLMKSKSSVRTVPVPVCRRDDSALQQQDGIQSAILHCKRSYSSSSSSSSCFSTISQECTVFSRSASESSHQKAAINHQNVSSAEGEIK